MKAAIILLVTSLCLAQNVAQPESIKPRTVVPSDTDQLALVRIVARGIEIEARQKELLREVEKTETELKELRTKRDALVDTIEAKLPPLAKGKIWQRQSDGQAGILFVEVEAPKKSEAKPEEKAKP